MNVILCIVFGLTLSMFTGVAVDITLSQDDHSYNATRGELLLTKIMEMKGLPYVFFAGTYYGPTRGGFDCTSIIQYAVYQATGIKLPRSPFSISKTDLCRNIPLEKRATGDILFFTENMTRHTVHHLGMVSSDINRMWHVLGPKHKIEEGNIMFSKVFVNVKRC